MAELNSQAPRRHAQANKRRHPKAKPRKRFWSFVKKFVVWCLVLAVIGGAVGYFGFMAAWKRYDNWAAEFDLERINDLEKPSIIFDRNGEEIGRIYVENRSYVTRDKIAATMVNALVAQEDSRFWVHPGYDFLGILRAAKEYAHNSGEANQGASSITQQLARNAYDLKNRAKARNESSFGRKFVEIALARRITERYSKDQVLEFYMNRVYFGSGFYGIRAASLGYFGKEPADLTTREAASIAALIKNPNGLSPLNNPEGNLKWRNHVLARMAKEKYITQEEAARLSAMDLGLNPKPLKRGVSHIYDRISAEIIAYLGEERVNAAGLKIYTTLDRKLQEASGKALEQTLENIEKRPGYRHQKAADYHASAGEKPRYLEGAALIVDNQSGAVLAYHGGRDYTKRQYDAIKEGARPTGTAILPFLYATAFDTGRTPVTRILDDAIDNRLTGIGGSEGILGEWGAESSKNRYEGMITAHRGLAASKIAASLRMGMDMGTAPFVKKLTDFGIRKPVREAGSTEVNPVYRPKIFVGTEPASLKEMTLAYTAIPNGGTRPENIYYLDRIEDEKGQLIWESTQAIENRNNAQVRKGATSTATAFQLHNILHSSLKNGSARRVADYLPRDFKGGVKTGTTYDFADNWLFGYDSRITCGVWIGFLEGKKPIYDSAFSSDTCAPVLGTAIAESERLFPPGELAPPPSVERVEICLTTGKRATHSCYDIDPVDKKYRRHTMFEYLRKGDSSLPFCDLHGEGAPSLSSPFPAQTRILPLPPILPTKPILMGDDPYHTELDHGPANPNLDLLGTNENVPEAQAISSDPVTQDHADTVITLPAPKPITIPVPEFIHL